MVVCVSTAAYGQLTLTGPEDRRIVVGQDPNATFVLRNDTTASQGFDATVLPTLPIDFAQGVTVVSGSGTLNAVILPNAAGNATGNLVVNTPALTGPAGSVYTFGVTVVPTANGSTTVNDAVNYSLVDNRKLTGSGTFSNGRHMLGQSIGTLALSGGSLTGSTGTNISVNSGGYAYAGDFLLTGTAFTFNGAGQSHALDVMRGTTGSYNQTVMLPASNQYNAGGQLVADFGGYSSGGSGARAATLLSAERIAGAELDLSGVTITATGTALADRQLYVYPAPVQVARVMQGQVNSLAVDTTATVSSTYQDDDQRTRLKLKAFDLTQAGVNAKLAADATFNSASSTATVALNGTITVDNATIGAKVNTFQLGGRIESLDNLAGENVQSDLPVSVKYNVLANNTVASRTAIIYAFSGSPSFVGQTFTNGSVGNANSTETHTNLTFDKTFVATDNAGTRTITSAAGEIVGEGLVGETVQSTHSYAWTTQTLGRAAITGTAANAKLKPGDTFAFENADGGQTRAVGSIFVGGPQSSAFNVGGLRFGRGGPFDLLPGEKMTGTVALRSGIATSSPDGFGRVYQATINARWYDQYAGSLPDAASGYVWGSDVESTRSWTLEHVVAAGASNDTTVQYAANTDLGDAGVLASSTRATTAALLDSVAFDRTVDLRVQFTAPTASQQAAGVVGDVVSITGLGKTATNAGILHVLQVGYAESLGTASELRWFNPGAADGEPEWINAVLGNSNIGDLDLLAGTLTVDDQETTVDAYLASQRYVGSYSSYLLASGLLTPELGRFGYDPQRNVAWAVIDHNSDFSAVNAVPEPAALALLVAGVPALLKRRRR